MHASCVYQAAIPFQQERTVWGITACPLQDTWAVQAAMEKPLLAHLLLPTPCGVGGPAGTRLALS